VAEEPGSFGFRLAALGGHEPVTQILDAVRFVLVEPREGGNIGAAARALKNLGFRRLDLVSPACDPRAPDARRMARDAADVLDAARVFDSLDEALAGAGTVVGTRGRKGKHRRPHWRLDRFSPETSRLAAAAEVAVLFGREAHGLSDRELDRCTHLVYFPSSDAYPSFNLAQSVLLVAYELHLALAADRPVEPIEPPADDATREAMYAHLEEALWAIGFLHEDSAEPMMRRIRRMLGKASLTPAETQILRAIARQTLWLAGRAGLAASSHPERAR
jgi:TrmH family RNA methyltransferase